MSARFSLRHHWPEYLMEAGELGLFTFFACLWLTLFRHPASPLQHIVPDALAGRALSGLALGATATAIVLTPWGKQSGGHFNPAITIAFCRMGKVKPWDALFYTGAQFLGALSGIAIARYLFRGAPGHPAVRYALTAPGACGAPAAFVAEVIISFVLMITVLFASNRASLARFTPYFAGALTATFITFEAPFSGASTNPGRSFGAALHAWYWHALWIYFTAPPLGMLVAAEVFLAVHGGAGPNCAKLHHANDKRCIFNHGQKRTNLT